MLLFKKYNRKDFFTNFFNIFEIKLQKYYYKYIYKKKNIYHFNILVTFRKSKIFIAITKIELFINKNMIY